MKASRKAAKVLRKVRSNPCELLKARELKRAKNISAMIDGTRGSPEQRF